ncbi:MAG TPA: hypothetical protein VJ142_02965 [Candidatus Nanoarchaeia archaeon]|nr:hypothetical protein [Candidatus Nanoarchaeia archaeon]
MKKTRKIKELKLQMKFNPGTMNYEPVLPALLTKNLNKRKKWAGKKF